LLWNDALFLLGQSQPKAFLFENVKGLADPRNAAALSFIMERIRAAGYSSDYYVLNSQDYGVAQSRIRIYIVGFRSPRCHSAFRLPEQVSHTTRLKDIINETIIEFTEPLGHDAPTNLFGEIAKPMLKATSLSSNNNGHNDYFLFNDIRNGHTTIHSWDIIDTTQRQKDICLLLLKNRRKRDFGPLDGNPLSLGHLQSLDCTIQRRELDELVSLEILKTERYAFSISKSRGSDLTADESLIMSKHIDNVIIPDRLVHDHGLRVRRIAVAEAVASLEHKGYLSCSEERYEFRNTKISTGLFGINRIFLPSSGIFPTLVASDSNDFLTPVSIAATDHDSYKRDFIAQVLDKQRYRKISQVEACRIQGFPDGFMLPDSRSRWSKLLGNSVAVPVVRKLIQAIVDTGVFEEG
jgi:DNA (cytosine-5)-methyltransferase 1